MSRIDHSTCTHPRTSKDRAACRASISGKQARRIAKDTKAKAAEVIEVTPITATTEESLALLEAIAKMTIDTEEGPVRVGSVAWILFRGDREALKCTITLVAEDIKNGRPGVEATDSDGNPRWAYAHQVAQIVTF